MRKTFNITGSEGNIYSVVFDNSSGHLQASCNCRAGEYKQLCKHILTLLNEDSEVYEIFVNDKYIYPIFNAYRDSVDMIEQAKKESKNRKKQFERVLLSKNI